MELTEQWRWRGRRVRWAKAGKGPAVVFNHGTPWSSRLWAPFADALREQFTTYLWDMPGYGQSSKDPDHAVSLDVQGELLHDLLGYWQLDSPHVVAHDYGGTTALRAHLLHGCDYASLALVDVVAYPQGSGFFRLAGQHGDVLVALPPPVHEAALRAYIDTASHGGLSRAQSDLLVAPWLDEHGRAAFYRQAAAADRAYTDQIEPLYPKVATPTMVVWGRDDAWIPVEHGRHLAEAIPDSRLHVIAHSGHLVHLDQPVKLAMLLHGWLTSLAPRR